MSEQDLIEHLAEKEHASWSHWMDYLFSRCLEVGDKDGEGYESYVIPRELVRRWQRQAKTPYVELTEQEKQSDRDEVAHILPIIDEYMKHVIVAISNAQMEQGGVCLHPNAMMRVVKESHS